MVFAMSISFRSPVLTCIFSAYSSFPCVFSALLWPVIALISLDCALPRSACLLLWDFVILCFWSG